MYQAPLLRKLRDEMDELQDVTDLISRSIIEDPPLVIREAGFIKDGYNEEVDRLRSAARDGKSWLADVEKEEKERTGITKMKLKLGPRSLR